MAKATGIGWTDATWNPWHGCTKVSPGCAHCYMYREKERYGQNPEFVVRSKTTFAAPLGRAWQEPRRIFTCSWSDFFHKAADPWRAEAWDIIRRTPQHTYQILTKRPERIREHLPPDWGDGWPHVWLGVSVENGRWVGRAVRLSQIPAVVRFVSAEPLLGELSFRWLPWWDGMSVRPRPMNTGHLDGLREFIDWVIVGGESGPDLQRREMRMEWLEQIVAECDEAGVPVYVKQDTARRDSQQGRIPGALWARKAFPRRWPRE